MMTLTISLLDLESMAQGKVITPLRGTPKSSLEYGHLFKFNWGGFLLLQYVQKEYIL